MKRLITYQDRKGNNYLGNDYIEVSDSLWSQFEETNGNTVPLKWLTIFSFLKWVEQKADVTMDYKPGKFIKIK